MTLDVADSVGVVAKASDALRGMERLGHLKEDASLGLKERVRVTAKRKRPKREPQTWALACGVGWLYGIGCVCGPFYGVGVGLTVPGGIIAGAGGGIGLVVGIGMGGGLVWGSGRGAVAGMGMPVPMEPPMLPSLEDLTSTASNAVNALEEFRAKLGRGEVTLKGTLAAMRPTIGNTPKKSLAWIRPTNPTSMSHWHSQLHIHRHSHHHIHTIARASRSESQHRDTGGKWSGSDT